MKRLRIVALATALLGTAALAQEHGTPPVRKGDPSADLRTTLRKLWEDHLTYTRNYIISALAELQDLDTVGKRLMKNQDDLGQALKPYYGSEVGDKFATLLRGHIRIAGAVVKAAKAGDEEKLGIQQKKWQENAKEIADFLSDINPKWARTTLDAMLRKHLELTTREVTARLKEHWAADIKAYDEGHDHMLMFADTLAEGIEQQFPEKFVR